MQLNQESMDEYKVILVERFIVESTNINTIGFNKELKFLDVEFKTSAGKIYRYSDVEEDTYEDLINAKSIGKYYLSYIKGKYEVEQL
jgi:hypothetical protein